MKKAAVILTIFILFFTSAAQAYEDITGTFSAGDKADLRAFLAATADITSYDVKNYDYDTLFKYILYTNENFRILTDIDPQSTTSGSQNGSGVMLVSSEFIDYIMDTVFHITPEKPQPGELTKRGFCYSNGYYMFTGGFSIFFATDITGIDNIYDLGGDTLLVTFSDDYTEGDRTNRESSYAIVRRESYGYSLLRLGMGADAPSLDEAAMYNPLNISAATPEPEKDTRGAFLLPILLLICALGICGAAISIVKITRTKK